MYHAHYGLLRSPFEMTPDPAFLWMSDAHAEGLATLVYGVKARKGFVLLTGEIGTGVEDQWIQNQMVRLTWQVNQKNKFSIYYDRYPKFKGHEAIAGFAAGTRQARNRAELAGFIDSPRVRVVACCETTADNYALVYAALRRKGRPVPTNDLWIAASALEHGVALLTLDAHFAEIDGLRCGRQLGDFLP